jgi:hypothetical protein
MPRYFASLTIVLLLGMVLIRVLLMKRMGIQAGEKVRLNQE